MRRSTSDNDIGSSSLKKSKESPQKAHGVVFIHKKMSPADTEVLLKSSASERGVNRLWLIRDSNQDGMLTVQLICPSVSGGRRVIKNESHRYCLTDKGWERNSYDPNSAEFNEIKNRMVKLTVENAQDHVSQLLKIIYSENNTPRECFMPATVNNHTEREAYSCYALPDYHDDETEEVAQPSGLGVFKQPKHGKVEVDIANRDLLALITCPISGNIMDNPVTLMDGRTFDLKSVGGLREGVGFYKNITLGIIKDCLVTIYSTAPNITPEMKLRKLKELKESLIDPISQEMIKSAVLLSSGLCYDRDGITKHLRTKLTCPVTNNPVKPDMIPVQNIERIAFLYPQIKEDVRRMTAGRVAPK